MELKEIKSIIDLMKKNGLTEFELQKDNVKIRIRREVDGSGRPVMDLSHFPPGTRLSVPGGSMASTPLADASSNPAASAPANNFKEVKSPMVGTFYRSPSPEAPPYVEIGQTVTEDTVVCIIEAMKVMNEIKAEMRGVITEVLLENAKPVEFGKPMFRIKPT